MTAAQGSDRGQDCLIVTPYYAPEIIGSAPYCTELAEWLAARGWSVRVLTARPRYPNAAAFREYWTGRRDVEVVGGVAVRRIAVAARSGSGALARLRGDLRFAWGACLRGASGAVPRAGVVVAFVPSIFSVAVALLLRRRGGRVVVVVHDIESGLAKALGMLGRRGMLPFLETFERSLLNRAGAVIVLSRQMADALKANGVDAPMTVLPIWTGPHDAPSSTAAAARPVTVMYSGALGRKQGVHQLVLLAERLLASHPSVRLVIQGAGSERSQVEDEVRARRLANVEFRDLVPKEQLLDSLRSADIHLVPQDARVGNYAIPSKLCSIMSAGRPFVCIAEPGTALDELTRITDGGRCVRPGDPDAFHRAVAALVDDAPLRERLGANGQRHARERLQAPVILKQYERIIAEEAVASIASAKLKLSA
jgi:colanic acid biosynthesis glycosyl transferase WcaI